MSGDRPGGTAGEPPATSNPAPSASSAAAQFLSPEAQAKLAAYRARKKKPKK